MYLLSIESLSKHECGARVGVDGVFSSLNNYHEVCLVTLKDLNGPDARKI